jgi:hypothetical protein
MLSRNKTDFVQLSLAALVWFLLVVPKSIEASDEPNTSASLTVRKAGAWTVVESPNFRCYCQLAEVDARRLAECCETWRGRLRKTWITSPDEQCWCPKCDVHVHPHRDAYNQSLNRPGDTSAGSTMMNFDQRRAVLRRIDVRADASDWLNAALPHELTHVVLGERFGGHALPRWADEGIAMLSESSEKHRERLTNLQETLGRRPTFRMADLVRAERMPQPHLRDAFYGQSVGLTSLLVRKSTPAKFADFIEESQQIGIDNALNEHYRINGIAALQREWDQWTRRTEAMEFVSLPLHGDINLDAASVTVP